MSAARSRSRSPVQRNKQEPCEEEIDSDSEGTTHDLPPSADRLKFYLENIPVEWTHRDVKEFIRNRTDSSTILDNITYVRVYKLSNNNSITGCCILFSNPSIARQTYTQLKVIQNKKIEGKFIKLSWIKTRKFSNSSYPSAKDSIKRLLLPTKAVVSLDTYGLSKEFLDQLGVRLPISNKIFVANLAKQVDEPKIREVFSNAGQIIDLFIIYSKGTILKMAKIEYDHPLEAVQAISMFHNQELYGRTLVVQIDNSPDRHSKPFPEGLTSIGPGLGPNGAPMRSMRYAAEIQPLKELLNSELLKIKSLLNPAEQSNMNQANGLGMMNAAVNMQTMTPLNINTMSSFSQPMPVANPFVNTQGLQNLQIMQGLLQQNVGSDLTSTRSHALQTHNVTPTLIGFGQSNWNSQALSNTGQLQMQLSTQSDSGSSKDKMQSFLDSNRSNYDDKRSSFDNRDRYSEEIEKNMTATDMLIFNNLPSSVTLSVLKNKMREVGEYKFVEMTDEGKAIVRFYRVQDAERCVKLFDRSKVDGQLIQVRYL